MSNVENPSHPGSGLTSESASASVDIIGSSWKTLKETVHVWGSHNIRGGAPKGSVRLAWTGTSNDVILRMRTFTRVCPEGFRQQRTNAHKGRHPCSARHYLPYTKSAGSMAQRDDLSFMESHDCRRYAPLCGEAKYPAGARPSKSIIIFSPTLHGRLREVLRSLLTFDPRLN
jgi:hypothetical protein